jgi:aspartyl-tRNA(Asn)/glutamyl-tRNA(Gln) amidotransferase subunit C
MQSSFSLYGKVAFMATVEEVKKLATLARIKIEDAELEKFTGEFDAILAYIGQLEKLDLPQGAEREKPPLRNVMREDGEPHASGRYTQKLVEQFPAREGNALKVKQIITHE